MDASTISTKMPSWDSVQGTKADEKGYGNLNIEATRYHANFETIKQLSLLFGVVYMSYRRYFEDDPRGR
jgi:hypothetical protein